MKRYSLTRRLIAIVLTVELLFAAGLTAIALLYERQQHLRTFDVMVRGRADSLLGAVQDAEDEADNVMLDPKTLDLQPQDLYEVRQDPDHTLGRSQRWTPLLAQALREGHRGTDFHFAGKVYRGQILHGTRYIDQEDNNPGIARPVTIFYAAPLRPVEEALLSATKFLVISNSLLLIATAAVLWLLMRRGIAPLRDLEQAAAAISSSSWQFRAPPSAHQIEELAVLAEALEAAMRRVEHSFRQQQRFLHDAAHELKTSVSIVKSSLQLLSSRSRSREEYALGLAVCVSDLVRLEDLVQRMLMLARLEQPTPAGDLAGETNVSESLTEVATQLGPNAELRGVTLQVDAGNQITASISHEDFSVLSTNLAMNALQNTPPGGSVMLRLGCVDNNAKLEVIDTGKGIAPEDLPHVFDRFYRGDLSRSRRTGGSGLGLSICKAIVDLRQGSISVASQPASGTHVTVLLPRTPSAAESRLQETFSQQG